MPHAHKPSESTKLHHVDAALNVAERKFSNCWSYLAAIKSGRFSGDKLQPLVEFQSLLANALFDLSQLYVDISKERHLLVGRKPHYSIGWFSRRMAFLEQQQQRVFEAVQMGRGMGDAYAWFFYQNDRELLMRHLQEPRPGVMSTGLGGVGELETAKNIRVIGRYFALHHCVTGMLRLGDVTLIDVKQFKVAGIGEIKSHSHGPRQVAVSITILSKNPLSGIIRDADVTQRSLNVVGHLSGAAKSRLERQLVRIKDRLENQKDPDASLSVESENNILGFAKLIETAQRGRISYSRIGKGLLLFAYRNAPMPLSRRLSNSTKRSTSKRLLKSLDTLPGRVQQILIPNTDNSLFVGLHYYDEDGNFNYLAGMTHPFWWPISPKLLKPVVFKDLVIGSVYNPAWLFKELEKSGFNVDASNPHHPKITRREGKNLFRAEGTWFYLSAIQNYLMGESAIVRMLTEVFNSTRHDSVEKKINLHLHQQFGRPSGH